ncbi:histidine-rich glycoprotein-like [Chrysoperla carnea]|uniref:histidine-rich glycoprotein-like n=1 Tax=Chrysoperla carnea TaxID=189513 RepID=UPI001D061814|nr:histidine-rich glycoprotein-like [Chrysoperla carnea]
MENGDEKRGVFHITLFNFVNFMCSVLGIHILTSLFVLFLIVSTANSGHKKVVIHIPYTVKNVKHTHTIYKTIHHKKGDGKHEHHHHHHHHHHHVDDHHGHKSSSTSSHKEKLTSSHPYHRRRR